MENVQEDEPTLPVIEPELVDGYMLERLAGMLRTWLNKGNSTCDLQQFVEDCEVEQNMIIHIQDARNALRMIRSHDRKKYAKRKRRALQQRNIDMAIDTATQSLARISKIIKSNRAASDSSDNEENIIE